MKVTVDPIGPCRKQLRIEVPADQVAAAFDRATQEYAKVVRLPGFRPGKAPRHLVEAKYRKEIIEEAERTLIPQAYREAIQSQSLKVVATPEVGDIQHEPGKSLSFSATVDLAPEFKMPEYKGLKVPGQDLAVSEEEVDKLLEELRGQRAHFHDIEGRPVALGDFAQFSYTATMDGKPLAEVEPKAGALAANPRFWLWMKPEAFVPGFVEKAAGMSVGEKRQIEVTFPDQFMLPELQGKTAQYDAELLSVRERHMPDLNDDFAKQVSGGEMDLAALRARIRENLEEAKKQDARRVQKMDLADQLLDQVKCDLPPSLVQRETQGAVYDIVQENQMRGITQEQLEEKKAEIYANAAKHGEEAVRLQFIAEAIAAQEKIAITNEDLAARIQAIAQQRQEPFDKVVEQLRKNDALVPLQQRILVQKVLDFALEHATVSPVPAKPESEPAIAK